MTPIERRKNRTTAIYRSAMAAIQVVLLGILGYVAKETVPFIHAGYTHWKQQDERLTNIENLLTDNKKNEEITNRQIGINAKAIDFHSGEIQSLQKQTDNNTDAIFVLLKR